MRNKGWKVIPMRQRREVGVKERLVLVATGVIRCRGGREQFEKVKNERKRRRSVEMERRKRGGTRGIEGEKSRVPRTRGE